MGGGSVESVRLNGYIDKVWITDISIVSLFNIFVGIAVFIRNVFVLLKDFIVGNWLELTLYFCDANSVVYGIFLCF